MSLPGRGPGLPGSALQFTGAAAQSGSSAAGTRATGAFPSGPPAWALASRAASSAEWPTLAPSGANVHHPRHPEGNCNYPFFFSRHFSPDALLCPRLQGRVVQKANVKPPEVGRCEQGGSGARSSAPPRPQPRPRGLRPPARAARPGGQLYWHALRPEAGSRRPP